MRLMKTYKYRSKEKQEEKAKQLNKYNYFLSDLNGEYFIHMGFTKKGRKTVFLTKE